MDYCIRSKIFVRPAFDLSELLAFRLGIERVIFATEPIGLATGFTIIAVVIVLSLVVFDTEKAPAAIKVDINMQLFLSVVFFDTSTVDPDNITDAFNLGTVFDAFGIKHAVDTLKAFPRFASF